MSLTECGRHNRKRGKTFVTVYLRLLSIPEMNGNELCLKNKGGFRKQLELKKFKLFFLCIMHKEEGEENDKPRVVQSKQKEIM